MSAKSPEATTLHTRLMKCALEIEQARAYWTHADGTTPITAQQAFEEYWFGARTLSYTKVLLANMYVRFDAYPAALRTLHAWPHMAPDTRRVICHWHLQLADPLYRAFTGEYLAARRDGPHPEVTRDLVVGWMGEHGAERWTMPSRIQFASKLLSASYSAGLLATNRDPRPVVVPRIPDEALEYLLYLLRGVQFNGTLLANPYVSSVGLEGAALEARLRGLAGLRYDRQGDLLEFGWRYPDLLAWAESTLHVGAAQGHGAAS